MLYVEVMYKNQISNLKWFLKIILCHPCLKKKKRIIRIFSILSLIRAVNILSQATLPCAKHSDLVSHPTEKRKKKDRCLLSGEFLRQKKMCFPFTGGKLHIHFTPWIHVEG